MITGNIKSPFSVNLGFYLVTTLRLPSVTRP